MLTVVPLVPLAGWLAGSQVVGAGVRFGRLGRTMLATPTSALHFVCDLFAASYNEPSDEAAAAADQLESSQAVCGAEEEEEDDVSTNERVVVRL